MFSEQGKPGLKIELFIHAQEKQKTREQNPKHRITSPMAPSARQSRLPAKERRQKIRDHGDPAHHSRVADARPPMIISSEAQDEGGAHVRLIPCFPSKRQ